MSSSSRSSPISSTERLHGSGAAYATWWSRFGADILDSIIVGVPVAVIVAVFGYSGTRAGIANAVASFLYNAILDGGPSGQTFGKRAVGIWVRGDETGDAIGLERGAARAALPAIIGIAGNAYVGTSNLGMTLGLVAIVDGLWPLWDAKRQALHDKLAGSVVLRIERS